MNCSILMIILKCENKRQKALSVCLTIINHKFLGRVIFPRPNSLFFMIFTSIWRFSVRKANVLYTLSGYQNLMIPPYHSKME